MTKEQCFHHFNPCFNCYSKCNHHNSNIKAYFAVFAAFLVQLVVGGSLAIGNLLPYIASYVSYINNTSLINNSNNVCTDVIQNIYSDNLSYANWILSASCIGWSIVNPIGSKIYIHFNSMRWTVLIGGSIVCVGIYLTFYVIYSMYLIILFFGFIFGVGVGIFWCCSISCAIKWFPHQRGFVNGFILFGMGLGQILFAFIETSYINQGITNINITYTSSHSSVHCGYIFHAQIIQRIPQCFIVLAVITAVFIILATICFFEKPANIQTEYEYEHEYELLTDDINANNITDSYSYTYEEAIKTYHFWLIFCNCFLMMIVLCFVYAQWKVFAQQYLEIDDDTFLLKLATFASMMNAFGRIMWGYYLDKTHSYALTMGSAAFILTLFLCTMPSCYYWTNKKFAAFIWITVLYICVGATYTLIPPTLIHTFGIKYNALILAMISLADIPASVMQSSIVNIVSASDNRWMLLCSIMACIAGLNVLLSALYPMKIMKNNKTYL